MGLRLAEGVDLAKLETRFGFARTDLLDARKIELHTNLGLVWQKSDWLGVTAKGRPLLDALLADLVSDELVSA